MFIVPWEGSVALVVWVGRRTFARLAAYALAKLIVRFTNDIFDLWRESRRVACHTAWHALQCQ